MYVCCFSLGLLVIVSNQEQNVRLQDEQNTVWSVEKFKIQAYCLDHRQYLEYNYDIVDNVFMHKHCMPIVEVTS